jgi:hypothetical protein
LVDEAYVFVVVVSLLMYGLSLPVAWRLARSTSTAAAAS